MSKNSFTNKIIAVQIVNPLNTYNGDHFPRKISILLVVIVLFSSTLRCCFSCNRICDVEIFILSLLFLYTSYFDSDIIFSGYTLSLIYNLIHVIIRTNRFLVCMHSYSMWVIVSVYLYRHLVQEGVYPGSPLVPGCTNPH